MDITKKDLLDCKFCGFEATSSNGMRSHVRLKHSEQYEEFMMAWRASPEIPININFYRK